VTERRATQCSPISTKDTVPYAAIDGEQIPVSKRGEAGDGGQQVHDRDKGECQHEGFGDDALGLFDFSRQRRHRLVARVKPHTNTESDDERAVGAKQIECQVVSSA
jgi:hypothetical protein